MVSRSAPMPRMANGTRGKLWIAAREARLNRRGIVMRLCACPGKMCFLFLDDALIRVLGAL
jgi:hypothetical protein